MKNKTPYDGVINKLFKSRWTDNLALAPIDKQRAQLYKTLKDQVGGFWSGHTAYNLAVDGGFLVDGNSNTFKKLTSCGEDFMLTCNKDWKKDVRDKNGN